MASPYDYVSNGIWQDENPNKPPSTPNNYYPNGGSPQTMQSQMSANMSPASSFPMVPIMPANYQPTSANTQWGAAPMMSSNINASMMAPMMPPSMASNMAPNMASGMPPNMASGMPPNMASGMPPNMASSMQPNMASGMQPNMASGMPPNMVNNMAPNMTSSMPPNMVNNMAPNMASNMAGPMMSNQGGGTRMMSNQAGGTRMSNQAGGTRMMSNMDPTFNMAQNTYGGYGYGQQYDVNQTFNEQNYEPSNVEPMHKEKFNLDFDMEPDVPYFYINGERVFADSAKKGRKEK